MELIYEFTMRAFLGEVFDIGATPVGMRTVVDVTGGWVKGARLTGELVGPSGDWLTVGSDGFGRLDVRLQIRTDDGALIYGHYDGVLELAGVQTTMAQGLEGSFEDAYFRTTPHLETADERYAWVNHTVFVARGRTMPDAVEYEVFRVS